MIRDARVRPGSLRGPSWLGCAFVVALTLNPLPTTARAVFAFADDSTLHRVEVRRSDRSTIDAYVLVAPGEEPSPKPVIVLLHGSGCDSVFGKGEGGYATPFLLGELRPHLADWNVVVIEKRGVSFGDRTGHSGLSKCSVEYVEHATRDERIADARTVIRHLGRARIHDRSRLVVIGHSEGADVATASPSIDASRTWGYWDSP